MAVKKGLKKLKAGLLKVPPLSRGVIKLGKESALHTIHRESLADFFCERVSLPPHMLEKF
jgi:hypothetical protein